MVVVPMSEVHAPRPGTFRGWLFRSRRPLIRAGLFAFVTVCAALVLIRIVAPFVISTGLVRDGIEDAILRWTGYRVVVEEPPGLRFWPNPRIALENVRIEDPGVSPPRPLGRIERLSASFNLLDALGGRFRFRDFHLYRPHLQLHRDATGGFESAPRGLLTEALAQVKPGTGASQSLDARYDAAIGSISIEDGSAEIAGPGASAPLTGINAEIDWPRLGAGMKALVVTRIAGQFIRLELGSPQPLILLSGRDGALTAKLESPLATARFEGSGNLTGSGEAEGALALELPDVPGALDWLGWKHTVPGVKAASISGTLLTRDSGIRLDELALTIDGLRAAGAIELASAPGRTPKLAGTLAFNSLDLRALFLAAFRPSPEKQGAELTRPLRHLDIDLRLSAESVSFGPLEARHIGASLLAANGRIAVDIGDSEFEGGQMIAHFATSAGGQGTDLDITLRDADLGAVARKLAFTGPLPLGTGSFDADLQIETPLASATANDVSGTIKLYAAPGAIPGVEPAKFRALAGSKPFFLLSEAAGGDFDFDSAEIAARLDSGSADIRSARVKSRHGLLTLTGLVPYSTSGMALAGTLAPPAASAADPAAPPLRFFAGGSWPDPVISPASTLGQP